MSPRISVVCLLLLLTGCGGGKPTDLPQLVPVSGTLTQGGKPLEGATVVFQPEQGAASSGITDANGRFELRYSADYIGTIPGAHRVRISKMDGEAGPEMIPAKFNTKSEISQQVGEAGAEDLKIEI